MSASLSGRLSTIDRDDLGVQPLGDAPAAPDQAHRGLVRADADHDAVLRGPGLGDMLLFAVGGDILFDLLGDLAQGDLAQRAEIALPKPVAERLLHLVAACRCRRVPGDGSGRGA